MSEFQEAAGLQPQQSVTREGVSGDRMARQTRQKTPHVYGGKSVPWIARGGLGCFATLIVDTMMQDAEADKTRSSVRSCVRSIAVVVCSTDPPSVLRRRGVFSEDSCRRARHLLHLRLQGGELRRVLRLQRLDLLRGIRGELGIDHIAQHIAGAIVVERRSFHRTQVP